MANKTPNIRDRIRHLRREHAARRLKGHEVFEQAPAPVLDRVAELLVVSKELRTKSQTDRIMRANPLNGRTTAQNTKQIAVDRMCSVDVGEPGSAQRVA